MHAERIPILVNGADPSDVLGGRLFLGNARCAEEHGAEFDLVVNCTKDLDNSMGCNERKHIKHIRIPIDDDPCEALELFRILRDSTVLQEIDDAIADGRRCLVHCVAGAQRSAAVVACFLVARRGMEPSAAVARVRARRPDAFFGGVVNFQRAIALTWELHMGGILRSST
jgi:protein tyrosine phosphatase